MHVKYFHDIKTDKADDEVFKSILNLLPFKVSNAKSDEQLSEGKNVKNYTETPTKCVQEMHSDISKILPNVQNTPIYSVNISTSNLSQVFKNDKAIASESQDTDNVHEGLEIKKVISVNDESNVQKQDLKQKHNCSFCQEVFGKYPNEAFTFDGCFLP